MTSPLWRPAPSLVNVAPNEVHLLRVSLARPSEEIDHFAHLLTEDETKRASRYRFERDRSAFVARRGALREFLGRCLACPAFLSAFAENAYGKPFIPAGGQGSHLRFNSSHSAEVALIAVAREREVGVDIEAVDPLTDWTDLAERCFSERERLTLRSLPAEERCDAAVACWTRKEAYVKARGMGLSLHLDQFDVSLPHEGPARLIATHDDPDEAARWSMQALELGPGFAGALAVERDDWRLLCWDY